MRPRVALALVAALCAFVYALLIGQADAQAPPAAPPALKETVAPEIPGVIRGGTKIVLLRDGFMGTEGVISMPDGSLLFTEQDADRIIKVDRNDTISRTWKTPTAPSVSRTTARGG